MTEEQLENELMRAHNVGVSDGYSRAYDYVMDKAEKCFRSFGCTADVNLLHTIAKDLKMLGEQAHPGIPNGKDELTMIEQPKTNALDAVLGLQRAVDSVERESSCSSPSACSVSRCPLLDATVAERIEREHAAERTACDESNAAHAYGCAALLGDVRMLHVLEAVIRRASNKD